MVQMRWAILLRASNRFLWPLAAIYLQRALARWWKSRVRREECGQNKNGSRVLRRKCALDGLSPEFWGIYGELARRQDLICEQKDCVCCFLLRVRLFYVCKSTRVLPTAPECKCTRWIRRCAAAKRTDVFKRVRFYCPFFSIIFYYRTIKMLSQCRRLLCFFHLVLSPVCFIRTSGPRIFNQSAAEGFFFPLLFLSSWSQSARGFFFFPRISHFSAVHISLHKEIPRLLSADASELCRRCNMTLNWISVCLTCRLTDWLTAECLQSRPLYMPALAALWGMGMNISQGWVAAPLRVAPHHFESRRGDNFPRGGMISQKSYPYEASFGHDAARKRGNEISHGWAPLLSTNSVPYKNW